MSGPLHPVPPCPITGAAGSRLIQRISANLLIGLWKAAFRVDTTAQLRPGSDYGLWESPCGLVFFEPRVVGDADFYRNLYPAWTRDGPWSKAGAPRADFTRAASLVRAGDRVLDVGCGKAFLLYELTQAVPGLEVEGIDLSAYAIARAKPEVQSHLQIGNATSLPFADHSVDLVLSLNTLHNLEIFDLATAVKEINRVGKKNKWICVESFRDEKQKVNLLYWQLTCLSFFTPTAWAYLLKEWGYDGDYGFIFFD